MRESDGQRSFIFVCTLRKRHFRRREGGTLKPDRNEKMSLDPKAQLTAACIFLNSFLLVPRGTNWLGLSTLMGVDLDGDPSATHCNREEDRNISAKSKKKKDCGRSSLRTFASHLARKKLRDGCCSERSWGKLCFFSLKCFCPQVFAAVGREKEPYHGHSTVFGRRETFCHKNSGNETPPR